MYNQKGAIFTILIVAMILLTTTTFVQAQTYQLVTSITGSSTQTTNYFTIPSSEWRLTWSYTPSSAGGTYAIFSVFVYPKGETAVYVDTIIKTGATDTSGVEYIHQGQTDYYVKIIAANVDSYTIKVEAQQTATPTPTTPEYPLTVLVLALVATVSLASVLLLRKRK